MATGGKIVKVTIKLDDQLSGALKSIERALTRLARLENQVASTSNRVSRTMSTGYGTVSRSIQSSTTSQHNLNNAIINGISPAKQLTDTVKTLAATYLGLNAAESIIKTSDSVTLATARIDLFNDGLQTTEQLTDDIYNAAQRARGSYLNMMDLVAKYSAVAGKSFDSTQDVLAFTEILQKMFVVSGATGLEMYSASLQLKQALGTGRLMGEEFRAVMEAAPLFGQAIAEYMTDMGKWGEVTIGDLKNLASESQITSEVMIGAMFKASDSINEKFQEMPYTFHQVWDKMKNAVIKGLDDVWTKLTSMLNNGELDQFINNLAGLITGVVNIMVTLFSWIVQIYNFVSANWSWIGPIVWTIVAAFVAYKGAMLAARVATMIATTATMIHGATVGGLQIAYGLATARLRQYMITQWGVNAAVAGFVAVALPVLMIIIAVIALIYIVIGVINKLTGETISATGIIFGVISVLVAAIANLFIGLWNIVLEIIGFFWDGFAAIANFIGNVFNDPVAAVVNLFVEMGKNVLRIVKVIVSGIDAVTFGAFGLANKVQGLMDKMDSWADTKFEQKTFVEDSNSLKKKLQLDYISAGSAWNTGYNAGQKVGNAVGGVFSMPDMGDLSGATGTPTGNYDWTGLADKYSDPLGSIAGDVSDIADGVSVSNEDLKYMRQLAEQRAVNKFTTAEIKIDMNNSNTINGTQDIDGIVKKLEDKLYDAMHVAAEGVHV